ncbi:hypothetical protein [Streptomyces sclerotialus]|uniref:hypothetical protein n=1 Tax=Streptomyces sclerotialus TaxID=1957 RepID=UPI000B103D24
MDRQLQHPRRLPPFLAPYFAGKAVMDALVVSYAAEVLPFGIDHDRGARCVHHRHQPLRRRRRPADIDRAEVHDQRHRPLRGDPGKCLAALIPSDADVTEVAEAEARLVAMA